MDQSKKRRWLHVPSPAMIVACVALFIAMGGTSYAAATLAANSVGTKQIKKNAVTSAKIKSAAVTAAKVKDGTLTGAKVKDGTLTGAKVQDGTLTGADLAAGVGGHHEDRHDPGRPRAQHYGRRRPSTTARVCLWYVRDTVDFNVGGVYDAAQPTRMTAPVAGRYLIMATVRWESQHRRPPGPRSRVDTPPRSPRIARNSVSPLQRRSLRSLRSRPCRPSTS